MSKFITLIVFFFTIAAPSSVSAATYYVSSSGSDSNNGTSESTSWKTIDKVKSRTYTSGDQILFKAGNTWSGTSLRVPSSNITIGRYGTGANPIINTTSPSAIIIENKQNVTFDGVDTKSNGWVGYHVINSSYITLKNFEVYSNLAEGDGVNFQADTDGATHHITLEDFYIHGPMGWAISGYVNNATIRRGTIEGIGKAGGEGKHGMYIHSWNDFTIEDVTISDPWNSCIKIIEDVTNGTFRRVTCTGAGRSGSYGSAFMLGEGGGGRTSHILNMTFENNAVSGTLDGAIVVDCNDQCVKNATVNGIFYPVLSSMRTMPNPISTTPTGSVTNTPTPRPTSTPTPRPTSTPTSTPTATPRPTSTPTPTPGYCPSDIDRNYVVGGSDVQRILTKMATTCSGCAEDINTDGVINTVDYLQVQKSWGSCSV